MSSTSPRNSVAALLLAAAAAGAQAEGLYVGGALSRPDYGGSVNGTGGDGGSGVGLKLYGGWQFTPNFALEGGYADLGRSADVGGQVRAHGLYVDAVGTLPIVPKWSLLGSAGLADARFKTAAGNDSSPGLKLALGVKYELSKTTALRLGYDHYRFSKVFDGKASVGQAVLGADVAF